MSNVRKALKNLVKDGLSLSRAAALCGVAYDHALLLVYPERPYARKALQAAVRCGDVWRPAICSECRNVKLLDAHHPDYGKPLDVEWLCVKCHCGRHPGKGLQRPLMPVEERSIRAVARARQIEIADLLADYSVPEILDTYRAYLGRGPASMTLAEADRRAARKEGAA